MQPRLQLLPRAAGRAAAGRAGGPRARLPAPARLRRRPPWTAPAGIAIDGEYFRWAGAKDRSPTRWEKLAHRRSARSLSFWYRQGPRPLIPTGELLHRPLERPALARLGDDRRAPRLLGAAARVLRGAAPARGRARRGPRGRSRTGRPLFAEAGLDPARFTARRRPHWTPPFFCDRRQAWEGTYARPAGDPAARRGGRLPRAARLLPARVALDAARSACSRSRPTATEKANQIIITVLIFLLFAVGGWLAWRNLKLGRGDRRGAARLAAALFVAGVAIWVLAGHHVPGPRRVHDPDGWRGRLLAAVRVRALGLLPRAGAVRAALLAAHDRLLDAAPHQRPARPGGRLATSSSAWSGAAGSRC